MHTFTDDGHKLAWSWHRTFEMMWNLFYFDSYWSNNDSLHQYTQTNAWNCLALVGKSRRMYRNLAVNSKYWEIHWCLCEQHADVYGTVSQKRAKQPISSTYCFYCAFWLSIISLFFSFIFITLHFQQNIDKMYFKQC